MQSHPFRFRRAVWWFILAALPRLAFAQLTQTQSIDDPLPVQQCSGPLASMMPECRQGGNTDVPGAVRRLPGAAATTPVILRSGASARMDGAAPAAQPEAAPQPPTEFQQFVASSVGRLLLIYGASLFDHVPTTFAPLDRVPVTADYVIGPGDEILLRAWGQVNLDLQLTADRAG